MNSSLHREARSKEKIVKKSTKNAFAQRLDTLMEICDEACKKRSPSEVQREVENFLTNHDGGKYRRDFAFRIAWSNSLYGSMGDLARRMGDSEVMYARDNLLLEELKEHMVKAVKSGNMKPVAKTDVEPV